VIFTLCSENTEFRRAYREIDANLVFQVSVRPVIWRRDYSQNALGIRHRMYHNERSPARLGPMVFCAQKGGICMTQLEFDFSIPKTTNRTVRFQACLSCRPSLKKHGHHCIIEGHEYVQFCAVMCADHAVKALAERVVMGETRDRNGRRILLTGRKSKYRKHQS
jgi:hypothetical protein